MRRFQRFPIYILYSLHRQQAVDPLWKHYNAQEFGAKENAKRQLFKLDLPEMWHYLEVAQHNDKLVEAAIQWQLIEDLEPKYRKEIQAYETTIERILTVISHTSIGIHLLSMIKGNAKVFIIPADWTIPVAKTNIYPEAQGGGIRIHFNPSDFQEEAEDTLVHELVHAMRMSNGRYGGKGLGGLAGRDFGNSEEFIATQFENVFHAARRTSDTYSIYRGVRLSKERMYEYLIENAELVMALKYFLDSEPLARVAAGLHQPDYNPFRDFAEIEQRSLKHCGLDKFMAF